MLIHSLRRGGAERVALELSLGLQKKGHVVEIVAWVEVDEYQDVDYLCLKKSFLISKDHYNWISSIPNSSKLLKEKISEFKPDVIQAHSPNISWLAAYTGVRSPYMHVLHGFGEITMAPTLKNRVLILIYRLAFKKLNAKIATVSKSMISQASSFLQKDESQFFCLPNGVDLDKFKNCNKLNKNSEKLHISMIGTLCSNKGQVLGIRAFELLLKKNPNVILEIVGDGPDVNQLILLAKELKISENIVFRGRQNNIAEILAKTDILWQLSRSEAMPMVVLESLASGIPVVGFFVRGIKDVILQNETGYMAPYGDIEQIVEYTHELMTVDMNYKKIAIQGRAHVATNFSLKSMIENHERNLLIMSK